MRSVGVVADTAFTWSVVEFQPGRYHFPVQTNSETFAGNDVEPTAAPRPA